MKTDFDCTEHLEMLRAMDTIMREPENGGLGIQGRTYDLRNEVR